MKKRQSKPKERKRSRWFLLQLLVITCISLGLSSYAWGFWGTIRPTHFRTMVMCLMPFQKADLADALNEYYSGGIIRSSKGILLKCKPETDDIVEQFDWYTRGPIGSKVTLRAPDYHHVVVKVVKAADVPEWHDFDQLPTWMNEALLWHHCQTWKHPKNTGKDRLGLALGVLSLTIRFSGTINPVIGAYLSGIGVVNAVRSDPVKATPGVIIFLKIRSMNALITFASLWLLKVFLLLAWKRRGLRT